MKQGKRTKEWQRIRRQLKTEFERKGVTSCEMCNSTFALSFSHRYKRRFITTEDELRTVILVCAEHHQFVENHPNKVEIHNQIIEQRGANQ